jgi:hypothetical protein
MLSRVERLNLVLAGLAVALVHLLGGSGLLWNGCLVGALCGVANWRAVVFLGRRIALAKPGSRGAYAILFGAKLALLLTVIYLAFRLVPMEPLGFLIGISTLLPTIFLASLVQILTPASEGASTR